VGIGLKEMGIEIDIEKGISVARKYLFG